MAPKVAGSSPVAHPNTTSRIGPVAQLDRAAGFEPAGREFEPLRGHQDSTRTFKDSTRDRGVSQQSPAWTPSIARQAACTSPPKSASWDTLRRAAQSQVHGSNPAELLDAAQLHDVEPSLGPGLVGGLLVAGGNVDNRRRSPARVTRAVRSPALQPIAPLNGLQSPT